MNPMKTRTIETSLQLHARGIGLLYLIVIIAGIVAQMFISGRIVVSGDAAATAGNILTQKELFQLGFTIYLIEMASQIAMTVLFYILLKPVHGSIALLALFFGLTGCIVKTVSRLFYIAPLLVLQGSHYVSIFNLEQVQGIALLLLEVNDQAAGMALPFFGLSTLLNGVLVFRSTFLPKTLGVLSMLGGLGWLTYIYPPLGNEFLPYILIFALVGSMSQILWLLIKGIKVEEWKRLAVPESA